MVKEGFPFVGITFLICMVFAFFGIWIGAIIFAGLTLFMVFFFRNPNRTIPTEPNIIVAPADGRVTRVEENEQGKFVSIFLSPFDVHVNRSPIAGKINKINYVHGKKCRPPVITQV
jgi:phosphatidylserine decarboxylase